MADLRIKYGLKANLPAYSSALEGALCITTDERAVYANIGGSQFRIGDFQVVANVSDLPAAATAGTALFFVAATNALAVSNGSQWIQVNTDTDTGATHVDFTGGSGEDGAPVAGEVLTGAAYDASTRTITFTVAKVNAQDVVYKNSNVKAALDNKVDHILTSGGNRALVFNETDGGGAKFENADGTHSFVGVNDGGHGGIAAQIYAKNKDTNVGARLNISDTGIFYTNGLTNGSFVAGDELVTKKELSADAASKTVYLKDESNGQEDYAKVYKLYQGASASDMSANALVGTINIPKDLVVQSGSVETVVTADEPYEGAEVGDKYIELVIQNQSEPLYIPAKDLVDIYTAQQNAAQVQLVIDGNNVISASIVAGSIGTTELADEAVTIAKLAPATVGLINSKVEREIQSVTGKALIFNESDGGGAKFEHADGTMSFVGVNDGGADGLTGQIYTVAKDAETGKNVGTRINMTKEGFFYTNGADSAAYTADDEIATKGDIEHARLVWESFDPVVNS